MKASFDFYFLKIKINQTSYLLECRYMLNTSFDDFKYIVFFERTKEIGNILGNKWTRNDPYHTLIMISRSIERLFLISSDQIWYFNIKNGLIKHCISLFWKD